MTLSYPARPGSIRRFFSDMREGLRRQGNVVFALIFRDLKSRSGQDGYGLLSLAGIVLEPAMGVVALSAFWYLMKREEIQGVHVVLFLTVSMTGFSMFRRAIASVPKTIRGTRAFYAFPNVKPFDAVLARFVIELVLTVLGGAILLFLAWWFLDLAIYMDYFLEGMGVFAMLIAAAFGVSLFVGVYGTRFPMAFKGIQFMSRGLLFISAVMHPANELPAEAQDFLAWNPLVHYMEAMRGFFLGMDTFPALSFTYMTGFAAVSVFMGFISYYANRHKVIER